MKNIDATELAYKNGYEAGKKSVTKMDGNLYWSLAIKNIICVICLTVLAILFNKWWIILFSSLLFSYTKVAHKFYRVCDECGKHSPYADSYNDALEKAKANGWIHFMTDNKDYCSDCAKNIKR